MRYIPIIEKFSLHLFFHYNHCKMLRFKKLYLLNRSGAGNALSMLSANASLGFRAKNLSFMQIAKFFSQIDEFRT